MESFKDRWYHIIFHTDTKAGKQFDIALLWLIVLSVLVVILESIPSIRGRWQGLLYGLEWTFTLLFTIEYFMRLYTSKSRFQYFSSFWGVVDLLAILPTYIDIFAADYRYLLVIRLLRMLRVFRVLKLLKFSKEASVIQTALLQSRFKIIVFLFAILILITVIATMMYVVEGEEHGFVSIPMSMYWAVVTITTVGYGDISPQTDLGKLIASIAMIIGYAVIAVPTGIISSELAKASKQANACKRCNSANANDANYCQKCGERLVP